MSKIAYTVKEAAAETGLSDWTIKTAIHAGDLATLTPMVDGKPVQRILISHDELTRWLNNVKRE